MRPRTGRSCGRIGIEEQAFCFRPRRWIRESLIRLCPPSRLPQSLATQPARQNSHNPGELRLRQWAALRDAVPSGETCATAGGGGVLSDEYHVAAHRGLASIGRWMRHGQPLKQEIPQLIQESDGADPMGVIAFGGVQSEPRSEGGALETFSQPGPFAGSDSGLGLAPFEPGNARYGVFHSGAPMDRADCSCHLNRASALRPSPM